MAKIDELNAAISILGCECGKHSACEKSCPMFVGEKCILQQESPDNWELVKEKKNGCKDGGCR